jgi:hypothetical protein
MRGASCQVPARSLQNRIQFDTSAGKSRSESEQKAYQQ